MNNLKIIVDQRSVEYDIPSHWNEVPKHLYPSLARIYLRASKFMKDEDNLARALGVLIDGSIGAILDLPGEQQLQLCELVRWVWADMNLTENLIPEFDFDGVTYIGPVGDFSNIRFGEFVMAETYFSQYIDSNMENSILLDKLITVLYRPIGIGEEYVKGNSLYRGDRRQKFNTNLIDYQSTMFLKMDLAVKDGIYLWYATARERFFSYFKLLFSKRKSSESSLSKTTAINWGWYGVFDDLLGEKGRTAETLEDEFVSVTLMSLERAQEKNKSKK